MTMPDMKMRWVRKVFDDGNHDAFTDLCRFKSCLYLCFRSCPDGHPVHASSRIVILSSEDGCEWEEVYDFAVEGRDTRDPHFLIFRGSLFVYSGCWQIPAEGEEPDMNDHLGYAAITDDGRRWKGPVALEGTYGYYIWRAASVGREAYMCARRRREFAPARMGSSDELVQAVFLKSRNGLVWSFGGYFAERYGDETAFLFEDDESILALMRGRGNRPARICRSPPPYNEWIIHELDRNVGGPLLVRWNGRYLVGGRNTTDPGSPKTTLYWLEGHALVKAADLPSGGDNSYPGFVAESKDRALVSYYSGHEDPESSIYLAEIELS